MIDRFLSFNSKHKLFEKGEKLIAAVSGGIDSVVMVHLLHKAGVDFAIAHCNFGLRGEESDADEQFVKKLSKKYKVPFFVQHFETAAFAQTEKISIQMAARALRYNWFNQLLETENYDYIATAHHQNDLAETMLLNLTKGTGIAGLHGIAPKNKRVIRPILFMEKDDIYDMTASAQLIWREDSSNASNKYQRNLIRNEVVPRLKEINPNFETTLAQSAEKISAVEQWFLREVQKIEQKAVKQEGANTFIDTIDIAQLPEKTVVLFEILKPYGFNYDQASNLSDILKDNSGKSFESPTHKLTIDRTQLIISPKQLQSFQAANINENQDEFSNEHLKLSFEIVPAEGFKIPTDPAVASLDADKIQWPIQIRKWKEGDWFVPLGMNTKKKISDFLIDTKVPLPLKNQVFVLTTSGSIVWIAGKRIDNRFKVSEETQRVLLIRKR